MLTTPPVPIQSVLDVLDQTALPRNPELRSAYSRSIIVLAPTRALKFTAVSAERHALWMTALSFLAQSGRLPSQIPPLPSEIPQAQPHQHSRAPPPIPDMDGLVVKRHRSPSFGRLTVRDSIRLAKGKRPDIPKSGIPSIAGAEQTQQQQQDDSADFPAVPRLYVGTTRHQRKRSNSAVPRLPTTFNGFRSSSSTAIASYTPSASGGLHPTFNNNSSTFFRANLPSHPASKSGSRHDSMAGGGSADHHHHHQHPQPNFFEAVGTVRMEAFVDPNVRDGILYVPAPPPGVGGAPDVARRRRGSSHVSQMSMERRRGGHVFDDPFRSFDFSAGYEIPAR